MLQTEVLHDPTCSQRFSNYICDDCFEAFLKSRNITRNEFKYEIQQDVEDSVAKDNRRYKRAFIGLTISAGVFAFSWTWLFGLDAQSYRELAVLGLLGSPIAILCYGISALSKPETKQSFEVMNATNKYVIALYRKN